MVDIKLWTTYCFQNIQNSRSMFLMLGTDKGSIRCSSTRNIDNLTLLRPLMHNIIHHHRHHSRIFIMFLLCINKSSTYKSNLK